MAKKKATAIRRERDGEARASEAAAPRSWLSSRAVRETVESVVIAFVLAFLFRTFEAEAFVIPTGSMAPTLMGAHKDLNCPECGFEYRAGASSEESQLAQQVGRNQAGRPVVAACCPMCRYQENVGPGSGHPTYGGDRILVSKFSYDFSEPNRWDVIVFKYPGEAQTNFIKRCVGLPNEAIRIRHGDLYVKPEDADAFSIAHRGPSELRAMAQIVYDNDYVVDSMTKAGWPLRWQPWPARGDEQETGWTSDDGGRSFAIGGQAPDERWLRYRHFVPSLSAWKLLAAGRSPPDPQPLLITDFYAYNTSIELSQPPEQARTLGLHWVGDLLLECELESIDGRGTAWFDLVKAGRHYRCALDCETGEARLAIDGVPDYRPRAQTAARGAGRRKVMFANVDHRLHLWIDGKPVAFDASTEYEPPRRDVPRATPDDPLDLAPAGIGSQSAGLAVRHIRLLRDIYYIAASSSHTLPTDYTGEARITRMSYDQLYRFWSSPGEWAPPGVPSPFDERGEARFVLAADQFFMLGDNSPMSHDARLWHPEKFVSRELLVGRALLIFWPHSFNRIPGTSIPFPYFPNFARMGLIR